MASDPITLWQIEGKVWKQWQILNSYAKPRQLIKKQTLPTKVCLVKAMIFPVVIYRCESWTINNAECQKIDTFELWFWSRLESPLDCMEIKLVNPKANKPWIFIGRTDAEAEAPILWPSDAKSQFIGKSPDAGKDWGQEEQGATEDEMVGRPHWLNGHEFEETAGNSEGQEGLENCSPWGYKELNMT